MSVGSQGIDVDWGRQRCWARIPGTRSEGAIRSMKRSGSRWSKRRRRRRRPSLISWDPCEEP